MFHFSVQHGLIGVLGIAVRYTIHAIAVEVRKGTEVAETPDAGAIVLGAQKILILVVEQKVKTLHILHEVKVMKCVLI